MSSPEEAAASSARFGVGEFPAALDRVNWAAVLMGELWAVGDAQWLWLVVLVAADAAAGAAVQMLPETGPAEATLSAVAAVVSVSLFWCLRCVVGVKANRRLWLQSQQALRGRGYDDAGREIKTVADFLSHQRAEALVGLVLWGLGFAALLGLTILSASGVALLTLVAAALGCWPLIALWLFDRRRTAGWRMANQSVQQSRREETSLAEDQVRPMDDLPPVCFTQAPL